MVWAAFRSSARSLRRTEPAPISPRSDDESPRDFGGAAEAERAAAAASGGEMNPAWRKRNKILEQFDGDSSSDEDEASRKDRRDRRERGVGRSGGGRCDDDDVRVSASDSGSPKLENPAPPYAMARSASTDAVVAMEDGGGVDVLLEAARLFDDEPPPVRVAPSPVRMAPSPVRAAAAPALPPPPVGAAARSPPRVANFPASSPSGEAAVESFSPVTQRSPVAADLCVVDMTESVDDLEAELFGTSPGRGDLAKGAPLRDPMSFGWGSPSGGGRSVSEGLRDGTTTPPPVDVGADPLEDSARSAAAAARPAEADDPLAGSSQSLSADAASSRGSPSPQIAGRRASATRKYGASLVFGGGGGGGRAADPADPGPAAPKPKNKGSFFNFGRKRKNDASGQGSPSPRDGPCDDVGAAGDSEDATSPGAVHRPLAAGNVIVVAPRNRPDQVSPSVSPLPSPRI